MGPTRKPGEPRRQFRSGCATPLAAGPPVSGSTSNPGCRMRGRNTGSSAPWVRFSLGLVGSGARSYYHGGRVNCDWVLRSGLSSRTPRTWAFIGRQPTLTKWPFSKNRRPRAGVQVLAACAGGSHVLRARPGSGIPPGRGQSQGNQKSVQESSSQTSAARVPSPPSPVSPLACKAA